MRGKATALDALSEREQVILQRLSAGLSDQEIADDLFLSVNTVKWYNHQLYGKLGVNSRTQAIAWAKDHEVGDSGSEVPLPVFRSQTRAQPPLFIGRSREMAEVKKLLSTARLLTFTGTGGIGKTQLALRVAAEVAGTIAAGVCFVDLAPLSDYTLVAQAIAGALRVVEQPTEPLLETLKRALAERELLLLLDNYEHMIQAAPVISELLAAAPRLKVLATSRESLRLAEEQEYLVLPLSLPGDEVASVEHLMASEAGLLFVRRVQMVLPHFEVSEVTAPVIGRICRRLDGVPLAIELAAAQCKLFTPQTLLEQLEGTRDGSPFRALARGSRDGPPRQRTLRDSIAWSYHLLEADEQRLFARLAVFRGGRSLEAIEGVCGEGLSMDVLDGLASLLDKSLVQQQEAPDGERRFVLLELIQEYAREQLKASGEEETMRRRHAEYFVALAERAEPELRLTGYHYWTWRLELDLDNIRAVLAWSLVDGEVALGVRLAGALWQFWYGNGYHVEGQSFTQALLQRLDEAPLSYQPKFLVSAGHLVWDDLDAARLLFLRARDCAREVGDRLQEAWALVLLGYTMLHDPQAAMPLVEEGLALFRVLGYRPGIARALSILGEIARFNGDDERARCAYEECLAVFPQPGERRRLFFLGNLAFIALHQDKAEEARDLACQFLQLARELNQRLFAATALAILAGSLGALGQPQRAARLLGASAGALERMGAFLQPNDQREVDSLIAAVGAQLDEETFQVAWAAGRALTLEQALEQVYEEAVREQQQEERDQQN